MNFLRVLVCLFASPGRYCAQGDDQQIAEDDPYYSKHFTDANGDYTVEMIEQLAHGDNPFFINLWWLVCSDIPMICSRLFVKQPLLSYRIPYHWMG